MAEVKKVLLEKMNAIQNELPNISKNQMKSRLYAFMSKNNIGYTVENLNCLAVVCEEMVECFETCYSIVKEHNAKSKNYGEWFLLKQHKEDSSIITDGVIFGATTRKECVDYAKQNNISINYIDSGRIPSGCKW